MDLTRSLVEAKAGEYEESQPLAAVEQEHVEMLPEMFAEGEFGWRDVEWVVQWYFRRYLGAYPDSERRETEAAFGDNTYEEVMDVLSAVYTADDVDEKLRQLLTLDGVDVGVGSAFLQFMYPEVYIAVDSRVWGILYDTGELDWPYPDDPSVEEYVTYHETCRELADQFDIDTYTLYRALWQLGSEGADG